MNIILQFLVLTGLIAWAAHNVHRRLIQIAYHHNIQSLALIVIQFMI